MRSIRLILTNNVNYKISEGLEFNVYRFDKNESTEEELKKIVIDINKSKSESVTLITNKENLFEFFNRDMICEHLDIKDDEINLILKYEVNVGRNFIFNVMKSPSLKESFKNNIELVLVNYGNIFQIDIEKLVKGTTYKVNNEKDLINLINEDLNLIFTKNIITSRLAIVFYRLTYFDLDVSKAAIGRFFANYFEKSESFKMNLNRNPDGLFFTDLNNKIFRGYKIKPIKIEIPDSPFELKIKIAKNLLKKKVKIEIIAEALELTIEELNDRIFGTNEDNIINNLGLTNGKKVQKTSFDDLDIPISRGVLSAGIDYRNNTVW